MNQGVVISGMLTGYKCENINLTNIVAERISGHYQSDR